MAHAAAAGLLAGSLVGSTEAGVLVVRLGGGGLAWGVALGVLVYGPLGAIAGAAAGWGSGAAGRARRSPVDGAHPGWLGAAAALVGVGLPVVLGVAGRPPGGSDAAALPVGFAALVAWILALALALASLFRSRGAAGSSPDPRMAVGVWAAVAAALALTAVVAGRPASGAGVPTTVGHPNLVLVLVDTLRADALGSSGSPRARTPRIDRLAADGVVFRDAVSPASWTRPSVVSLLSSTSPSAFPAMATGAPIPESRVLLAEVLRSAGYTTGALVNNLNASRTLGLAQGFVSFQYLAPSLRFLGDGVSYKLLATAALRALALRLPIPPRASGYYWDAPRVTAAALRWLERHRDRRFFLMVHYMDPHDPYFSHPPDGVAHGSALGPRPRPGDEGRLHALYSGEVAYLDRHLGDLFTGLERLGLYDGAAIVLTSDHGEEFMDHGGWFHSTTVYQELVHVPLLVKLPGGRRAGEVEEEVVRTLDIPPTLAHLAGTAPDPQWEGRDLLAPRGGAPIEAFSSDSFGTGSVRSVRSGHYKLVQGDPGNARRIPAYQLFDLSTDPHERHDLCQDPRPEIQAIRAHLESRLAAHFAPARSAASPPAPAMDPATCAQLKALGYVDPEADCSGTAVRVGPIHRGEPNR